VYTAQKQLGKDAQLAAAEIVRRAERGIGLAIRRGQQNGKIRRRGDHGERAGGDSDDNTISRPGPANYATTGELRGNGAGIYHMTDGVSDEDFEEALAEAKTEQDLSRANVVRKIRRRRASSPGPGEQIPAPADRSPTAAQARRKLIGDLAGRGMSSRQIADQLGIGDHRVRAVAREHGIAIPADAVIGRTRRHDSSRIVRQTAHALEGLVMGVDLADPTALDPAEAAAWAASITRSTRALSRFARHIKEASP
jgi:hypothetical protein